MKIKVLITGATGMVGEGVLQECLQNDQVEKILLINRKSSGYQDSKIEEVLIDDFFDLTAIQNIVKGYDACFFCLGISSIGMNEADYTRTTYDLTLHFAEMLANVNPQMTFCYVSGAGTDSTEKKKTMWARVKGKTENDLLKLPLQVYNFRPAFMKPFKNAKHVKPSLKPLIGFMSLFRPLNPSYFLTLEEVGDAMINVSLHGYSKDILETKDISFMSSTR
ncbi:NAD-dependent epimerase/dehydratase family protein [Sphingobacterium sp. DK4209]|uniref:NAD-dependent epimerase/dehydratase family protein n=1 Tax=Sphingobacterium zhuxiongii TaxID=2662364 RepID=A0A5Q0QHP2_9SPHI|nr:MULTISPECIES: NAD-dependent epimerase/dehydratase family protein [unclassified Sphingobacterium]MVZ66475.1 NAD-dependent epimerase/dehydratase family protein [Sphingobacterium sp. DK4209]QGA27322.1 NAD-dependent epimerase/dehydratase family protein [Sphingobacterium sp. dk4302]